MRLLLPMLMTAALPVTVHAAPAVVADIAPVQSLVARVMAGVGEPALIVQPGVSEHHQSLRPSQSAMLDRAEVVFWVGPQLEPWLEKPLAALAGDATVVALFDSPGTRHLTVRHGATFEGPVRAEGEADQGDAGRVAEETDEAVRDPDDHAAANPGETAAAGIDGPTHAADDDHHHDGDDPHAWLDPVNAQAWLGTIAGTLSEADPANAATYARNAEAARVDLERLTAELKADLASASGTPYVVFHDAYQYFETRFGVPAAGSISLTDGAAPGPARLAALQDRVQTMRIACALSEPQFDPALIDTVFAGMTIRIGSLDPLGTRLTPGPDLYPQLLRGLATAIRDCTAQEPG